MTIIQRSLAIFTALTLVMLLSARIAVAQTADASDDASVATNDGGDGGDAGAPVCPASDERGPCLEGFKNAVCVTSTTQSGACVESACLRTESGAPALVCRVDAPSDSGCCSIGSSDAATPAMATIGFGFWLRRRKKRFSE